MNKILSVYKPIGLTPLQLIERLRKEFPEYKNEKIGYAGRLDPLAQGVMLLMIGEATKERDQYLHLPKQYDFEALFGIATDTYDLLGKVISPNKTQKTSNVSPIVSSFVSKHIGKMKQTYPPYSSKAVNGKPLFWWAKQGKLESIVIPSIEVEIYDFKLHNLAEINGKDLLTKIEGNIAGVHGDFRQEEIILNWKKLLSENLTKIYQTASFSVQCSSGTYVRGLVDALGKELGSGAVTLSIKRTTVGEFSLKEALRLSI